MLRHALCALALTLTVGCLKDKEPQGLARTPPGEGPVVRFEIAASARPQLPFPNDLLSRPDPTSPTGLRLNLPLETETQAERAIRESLLGFDGFSTFGPITVSFSAPLDLGALDGRGRPYAEDPVLLLDLTEGETFGARVPLDLGRGHYPLSVADPDGYFDHDPRAGEGNLLFETVDEDHDKDGALSPHEDTDGDGVLDRPNVWPEGGDPERDLLTWYERETDTLILRPIVPLRPGHTYAVVLTRAITDAEGRPIRSPFEFVHHARQTTLERLLPQALEAHGVGVDEVAFTWLFTTQSATLCLEELERGLWGEGPYAALGEELPADITRVSALNLPPTPALLPGDQLAAALKAFAPHLWTQEELQTFSASLEAIDYVVAGRLLTPDLRDPERNLFDVDPETGRVGAQGVERGFICAIPKPTRGAAPFPVALYAHDFEGHRLDALRFAGVLAEWGLATCALDAPGYGLTLSAAERASVEGKLEVVGMAPLLADWSLLEGDTPGYNDWLLDSFGPNTLQSRDKIRQSVVDWLQFIRALRQFDGQRRWLPGLPWVEGELLGDFNGDGQVDLGGPSVDLHMFGVGFGGMLATITAGVSPELTRLAPIASGGGLSDLGARTDLPSIAELLLLPAFGPLLVGDPNADGFSTLSFLVTEGGQLYHADPQARRGIPVTQRFPNVIPGERVEVENLTNGAVGEARVNAVGGFRVGVPADAGDQLRVRVYGAGERLKAEFNTFEEAGALGERRWEIGDPLVAPSAGWGLRRQSPDFRHFIGTTQLLLEAADPINYARLVQARGVDTLLLLSAGDPHVPTSTGLSLARALGLVSWEGAGNPDEVLIAEGVVEGQARLSPLADVDVLSDSGGLTALEPPLRISEGGSALRVGYFDPQGVHGVPIFAEGAPWDGGRYVSHLLGQFLSGGGAEHRACLSRGDCLSE